MSVKVTTSSNAVSYTNFEGIDKKGRFVLNFMFTSKRGNNVTMTAKSLVLENGVLINYPKAACWAELKAFATGRAQAAVKAIEAKGVS